MSLQPTFRLGFATLFVPRFAQKFGWANTFALAMLPVALVLLLFALLARDSPRRGAAPTWADYAALLQEPDAGWFCLFYCFTFGGFVGLASFLTIFFHDQYGLSKVRAGDFTTIVVLAGSVLRPVGGWLSDKIGGYRLLMLLLAVVAGCLMGVARLPGLLLEVVLLSMTMGMLGMGNGAVFQLLPQRFSERVGVLTGLVGAAGGLGGFFLPFLLGAIKQRTGQYSGGLFLFASAFFLVAVLLLQLGTRWRATWHEAAVERAGIFSYRNFAGRPASEPAE